MQEFFGSVWWLIVSLGVLVTFHEYGHFWVARRFGIRVLRFSVGFGRPLWKRIGRDGTEYVVAAIPLGGYVKMLDEREEDVPAAELDQAFNRKPAWQRFLVALAGPAFNLALCLVLLWVMFMVGKTDFTPVLGKVEGIAAEAGLLPDDRIARIDGQPMPTWTDAATELVIAAIDRRPVKLTVERPQSGTRLLTLDLSRLSPGFDQEKPFEAMGLSPRHWNPLPVVGSVSAGDPAAIAGLLPGDRLISIGSSTIATWRDIPEAVKAQAAEGRALRVKVTRGAGEVREFDITPKWEARDGPARWLLGIGDNVERAKLHYGPIDAAGAALKETWTIAQNTVGLLKRMLTGQASLRNISGPITIAQVANAYASFGLDWFLSFLAALSLSLCILNLLPIPILDGGHLVYCVVEMVKGSPVSERTQIAGQYVGLALLAGLMGLAFYNDIARLVS